MNDFESKYLEKLRQSANDTVRFFENSQKPERERSICRAYLRTIGMSFDGHEIMAPAEEPADVEFRMARFQIREIPDDLRMRHKEWKERERKYAHARRIKDISWPYAPPTPVKFDYILEKLVRNFSEKMEKYRRLGFDCGEIDALAYVNLQNRYLAPLPCGLDFDVLRNQGWRSFSVLFPPYGVLLFAKLLRKLKILQSPNL